MMSSSYLVGYAGVVSLPLDETKVMNCLRQYDIVNQSMEKKIKDLYMLPRKARVTKAKAVAFDTHANNTLYQTISIRPALLKARRGSLKSSDAALLASAARHCKLLPTLSEEEPNTNIKPRSKPVKVPAGVMQQW